MNSRGDALGLPSEYILQIDGNVKAKYQLFVDAIKAGLQLKQLYPLSDIKVRDANDLSTSDLMQI
jgi:hypothetical protein